MKLLKSLLIVLVMVALATSVVAAGGDKVHGDEGEGLIEQQCLNFEDGCPYGDESPAH